MDEEIPAAAKGAEKTAIVSSIFVGICLILLVITIIVWPFGKTSSVTTIDNEIPAVEISPEVSIPATISTASKTYTSDTLGISFKYNEIGASGSMGAMDPISIEEIEDTVYVYPASLGREGGQFVKAFNKERETTLAQAIREQFLQGKDPTRCRVTVRNDKFITRAEITYPLDVNADMETFFENTAYCSLDYAQTNGERYFIEDARFPDTFFFVNIGQYSIFADAEIPWQDTIQIIN